MIFLVNVQSQCKISVSLLNQESDVVLTRAIENNAGLNVSHLPVVVFYLRSNATGAMQQILISR